MIRFHYMARNDELTIKGLSDLSSKLNEHGYHSVLLVYSSVDSDFLIKVARVLNKNHKIKYMPAIRTYALSPEYFGKICRAFDEIQKNRLMVNIVSGDITENETFLEDVVGIKSFISSSEQRISYTKEWVEKFLNLKSMKNYPEIIMSGTSDSTIKIAKDNNLTNLVSWFNYKDLGERQKYLNNYNTMINFGVIVRDSLEEADFVLNNLNNKNSKKWTIAGTEKTIKEHVLYLKDQGIRDFQITTFFEDSQSDRVHKLVKEMEKEING